jgi:hypothetical protein
MAHSTQALFRLQIEIAQWCSLETIIQGQHAEGGKAEKFL